ncbi:hypothetical protein [Nocardioides sp.]|uniref:hypothetical protein n=1 Tax=Nocardioides sp. TaxID=35761 RepID=UPI0031FE7534|nr:hypothetical protein [Nocardioides sp.]
MNSLEDRLTSALAARADLVQPEDLRPDDVPAPKVLWLRRPAMYAVAAAACAAVIAAPFVMGGDDDGEPSPAPPAPSLTKLPPQQDIGGDWAVRGDGRRVDVDGDGTPDNVRVRAEKGDPIYGRLRIEADLSSTGSQVFGIVDSGGLDFGSPEAISADSDEARELVLYRDGLDAAVLDLVDDQLVEATLPVSPPLLNGAVPASDPHRGYDSRWWIEPGTRVLYSYLSVDTFSGIEPLETPRVYPVEVTAWSLVDGALMPSRVGRQCIDRAADPTIDLPVPCAGGPGADVPDLFPEATDTIGLGESFETEVAGGTATVSLEGTATHGSVADGDAELVLTLPDGTQERVSLPGGWAPVVYTKQVAMADDNVVLLVSQEGGDSNTMTLVTTWNGNLFAARTEGGVPFGGGFVGERATHFGTWIGPDGTLYTQIARDPGGDESDVYSWALGGTVSADTRPTLQPLSEGCIRMDFTTTPADIARC